MYDGDVGPDNFGCQGAWALIWATVGRSERAIGVTEVVHFATLTNRWTLVARQRDCEPSILPSVVYRQGCFSN